MGRLALSLAIDRNLRSAPILDGDVEIEGVDLTPIAMRPADTFWRQLKFQEFDISEMSMSSLLMARDRGDDSWCAIPVFPARHFFHVNSLVHRDAGIDKPEDLKGKRIGVPDYQQTAALWVRGILKRDFGVEASDMRWFAERTPNLSHAGAVGFTAPEGVEITPIPPDDNQLNMLRRGELDAISIFIPYTTMLDRSTPTPPWEAARYLFADRRAEATRFYRSWGFMPINHCVVVRKSLVAEHPWLPLNIFQAFVNAYNAYRRDADELLEPYLDSGLLSTTDDLDTQFAYGVERNRLALQTLFDLSGEQGLTANRPAVPDFFHDSVKDA